MQIPVGKPHKRNSAHSVVPGIPMSLIIQKSCSAMASTILESHLHGTKVVCKISFVRFADCSYQEGFPHPNLKKQ